MKESGYDMMKRATMLLCAAAIILNLTACDNDNTSVTSEETTETSDVQVQTTSTAKQTTTAFSTTTSVSEETDEPTIIPEREWDIGGYQAWDYEGNNCDVSLRVHKSENNYYLEASSDGEVLSDVMLSSPYCGLGGILVDESDMAGNFTISESFNGGYYLTFITGNDDIRFFTIYCADDTGVQPIELQFGEDNVFEGKPGDELSYYGQYVYLGDKLIMIEYLDTFIPVPETEEGKTWLATLSTGENVYLEDGIPLTEDIVSYPYAILRYSTGKYADNIILPELFASVDDGMYEGGYTYVGDVVTTDDMFPYYKVSIGDELQGGYTVDEATLNLYYYQHDDGSYNSYTYSNSIHIAEEITLTGTLRYFGEDCDYTENGDLLFIPDGSYAGLPVPVSEFYFDGGITDMFDIGDAAEHPSVIYSDAVPFLLGNYFEHHSDNPDMVSIWNDLTENGGSWSSDVKITLSDVWLSCSVEGGLSGCAEIVAVEGIG